MSTKLVPTAILTLVIFDLAVWSLPAATLQGDVKDSRGQAVGGAEVHLQAKDGSGVQKIVRTDSSGHYVVSNIPNTDYEVVLFVNG
jgi:hypothetical protein